LTFGKQSKMFKNPQLYSHHLVAHQQSPAGLPPQLAAAAALPQQQQHHSLDAAAAALPQQQQHLSLECRWKNIHEGDKPTPSS
jgi:hypothetical protein